MKLETTAQVAMRAIMPLFLVHSTLRKFISILSPPPRSRIPRVREPREPFLLGCVTQTDLRRYCFESVEGTVFLSIYASFATDLLQHPSCVEIPGYLRRRLGSSSRTRPSQRIPPTLPSRQTWTQESWPMDLEHAKSCANAWAVLEGTLTRSG